LLCFLVACSTTQSTHFYTLSAPIKTVANQNTLTIHTTSQIEVLPVNVPDRFRRPQLLVNFKGHNHIAILEHDRWISTFDEELTDALKNGIGLPNNNSNHQDRYIVNVDLLQMNTVLDDTISAHYRWTIKRSNLEIADTQTLNFTCDFSANYPLDRGIAGAVKGNQTLVQDLIAAINQHLQLLSTTPMTTACDA
jgi:uncharacterized lipoprotein YmbA